MKQSERAGGFLTRLNPLTKGTFVLLAMLVSCFYDYRFAYFGVLPLCLILALADGVFLSYVKKLVIAVIVFISFIFFFKILLDRSGTRVLLDLGILRITEGALYAGLNQTAFLIVLVSVVLLFFETTEVDDLMISLQKHHVSHVATYVILSTIQLIPDMGRKSRSILQAQQARGIETEGGVWSRLRAFFPSMGPLIISSIADIEERSITLEARGFSAENEKTTLKEVESGRWDRILLILQILAAIGLIVWRLI